MTVVTWLTLLAASYLLGAINTAYLAGRLLRGVDIRTLGDGNAGAANAYRSLGPRTGIFVALVDAGKGAAVVVAARLLVDSDAAAMVAGFVAVAGHNWPVFLGFRGGRGAATVLGVLATLVPWIMLPLVAFAAIPLFLTRSTTVTLAFIFAPLPFVNWGFGVYAVSLIGYAVALCCMVGITHVTTTWSEQQRGETKQSANG